MLAGSSLLVVDREKERRPACVGINPPRRPDRTIAGTDKSIQIRYYLLSPARRPPSIFCLSAVPASVRATAAPPPAALSVCYCVTYASRELAAQQGPLCRPFPPPPLLLTLPSPSPSPSLFFSMPAGRQRSMASINVDKKGEELYWASANGKKDKVKAMIEALSPREEWTQVLNYQEYVSNVLSSRKEPPHAASYGDRTGGGRRCTMPSATTGSRSSRSWWGRGRIWGSKTG